LCSSLQRGGARRCCKKKKKGQDRWFSWRLLAAVKGEEGVMQGGTDQKRERNGAGCLSVRVDGKPKWERKRGKNPKKGVSKSKRGRKKRVRSFGYKFRWLEKGTGESKKQPNLERKREKEKRGKNGD